MIPADYYQYIYLFLVLLLTLILGQQYSNISSTGHKQGLYSHKVMSFVLCIFMTIFIGTRPASTVFVDMAGYASQWHLWDQGVYSFKLDAENLLFDNLRMFLATAHVPYEFFFILISAIYFGCMHRACTKLFPNDNLFAFLICLAAFSTFSYGTNGIKAGAAASLFLVAIAYYDNKMLTVLFILLSWGFHHSMVMVVASYLIVYFFHKPKWFFVLWIISLLIAAAHITYFQNIFGSMADDRGQEYLISQKYGKGFRIDFILYSAMPVLVGYYAIFKKKIQSQMYNVILCLYLITNAIWMLCMYAEFTNRIAYLSWFMYPVALIYPFLNENWGASKYLTVKKVSYAHIVFTLFMVLVFYA